MRRIVAWSLAASLSLWLAACSATDSATPSPSPASGSEAAAAGLSSVNEAAASPPVSTARYGPYRLVAMGDAYTHGTDTVAPSRDSWPAQLAEVMRRNGLRLRVDNLAQNGFTSGEIIEFKLEQVESLKPDVVTLQVGVNDIYAGELDSYRSNMSRLLDELLLILPAERIFTITTPDHTLTKHGRARTHGAVEEAQAAVAEVNGILRQLASERGITVIDISPVNELVPRDPGLVIGDLESPSAKQFAGWVELIVPHIRSAITRLEA